MSPPFRIGHGYDIHRLVPGRRLVLGGVEIPHPCGLEGHSDADCLTHAICDAILGGAGRRDIGFHFPDTDPQWQGADSQRLLAQVVAEVARHGWRVGNIDSSLQAEAPKIAPHLEAMKARLAATLGLPPDAIGIKATTNEGVDGIGRREAIAAHAVALLYRI